MKLSPIRVVFLSFFLAAVTPTITVADTAGAPANKAEAKLDALQREEVDKNINYLTREVAEKSRQLLQQYGQFPPFGAALFPDSTVKYAWTKANEEGRQVDAVKALTALRSTLRQQTRVSDVLATAVVYPYVRNADSGGDEAQRQINMELEYINGDAVVRAIQYTLKQGEVEFGASGEQEIEPFVFAPWMKKEQGG